MRYRETFSLIELMIAITLGIIILGLVTYTFHSASRASTTALSNIDIHSKARTVIRMMEHDLSCADPATAFDIGYGGNTLTFMTAVPYLDKDFDGGARGITDYPYDLTWVKYFLEDADGGDMQGTFCRSVFDISVAVPQPSYNAIPADADFGNTGVLLKGGTGNKAGAGFTFEVFHRDGVSAIDAGTRGVLNGAGTESLRGRASSAILDARPARIRLLLGVWNDQGDKGMTFEYFVRIPCMR